MTAGVSLAGTRRAALRVLEGAGILVRAVYEAFERADDFESVRAYLMFIGYPRSGHSLVGALLDAHPNVLVGHEVDALKFLGRHLTRNQLYALLLGASRRFAERGCVGGGGYSYKIPTQWQGRYRTLRVIGDKFGGGSSRQLRERPDLLDRLRLTVGVPVRIIHVVRNPYDNISTLHRRRAGTLGDAVELYFTNCETVAAVKRRLAADELLEIRHEDLISAPRERLAELCRFIGVDPEPDYLADCVAIVYRSPHKSRTAETWTDEAIAAVGARMGAFPFLAGYTFSD